MSTVDLIKEKQSQREQKLNIKQEYNFKQSGFVGPLQQQKPIKKVEELQPSPIEISSQKRRTKTIKTVDTTKSFKQETFPAKPIQTPNTPFRTSRPLLRTQQPLVPPGLPFFSLSKPQPRTKINGFFSVGVRRKGKEQTIATGLTRGQAKIRLRSELKGTLARSGRVRGLGSINLGFGFRAPKKGSILPFGSVVQKREFSLGSKGEKEEIKRKRKSKNFLRGIL